MNPRNDGARTRCLTTWLHPNIENIGWGRWIRTIGMTESKSVALPLGDTPISKKAHRTASGITPRSDKEKMGWIVGFEPTVSSATNWRFNQLSYTHHMARPTGLEPVAYCLEGSCSIQLSYGRIAAPKKLRCRSGAGDGNRTHTTSLEGWDSTIELHPQAIV